MSKHNDKKIGEVLKTMLQDKKFGSKIYETKIKKFWSETMGTTINKYTTEIRLKNNRLFLRIESAPLRQEISYGKEKLIAVLNKELGEDYITEIIIR